MNHTLVLACLLMGTQMVIASPRSTNLMQGQTKPGVAISGARHEEVAKHRIVFQVSSGGPEEWTGVLNNVDNLRRALGAKDTQIEVVCFGKGIGMVLRADSELSARIETAHADGVSFAACKNTLRAKHLSADDLLPGVDTVESGITEIVRRQEQGWSYIKGG